MKKKQLLLSAALISALSLILGGCGNTADTAAADTTASETSTDTATEVTTVAISEVAEAASAEVTYVYGTVNLPYADFYYGELNRVEPETDATVGQYDAADLAAGAGYEDEGMYDAVTSATTTKSTRFESSYYEETADGVNILGVSNVNVAITQALYDDVQQAIAAGTTCANPLMDIVSSMTVSDTVPVEYKVINSDGTLSYTIGNTVEADNVTAAITSISSWGNYQIDFEGLEIESAVVQGAILETSDGALYGLEHEDNLWLQPSEMSFAVAPFTEPHGNEVAYQRFADMPGKTITKITYLIANGDDIAISTDLYCALQLSDEYGLVGDESVTYSADGTAISVTLTVPEDSRYALTTAKLGRSEVDSSAVTYENDTLTLPAEFTPGSYTFYFEDDTYAGLKYTVLVDSGLTDADVSFNGSTIQFADDAFSAADYINNLSSVSINGEPLSGKSLGSVLFNEDGTLNLDAETGSDDAKTAVFPEGGSYEVSLESTGYPTVTFTIDR